MIQERKGKVLCIDDDSAILRSLQWLLEKDFSVKTAVGGEEGLRVLRENDFDVIISDQRMPGMTGAQFLTQAKQVAPRAIRLLLTGYSDLPTLLSSVNEAEIWRLIRKPWDNIELRALVHTAAKIAMESTGVSITTPGDANNGDNVLLISDDKETRRTLQESLGNATSVLYAGNLAEAMRLLSTHGGIGTIVSEARLRTADITRFLSALKQKRSEIVSVVVADDIDAEQLVTLINRGQVYRFLRKPVKKDDLKRIVTSAMAKHVELSTNPAMRLRHTVIKNDDAIEQALLQKLELAEKGRGTNKGASGPLNKIRSIFQTLSGRN